MPIYEYRCKKCGTNSECIQKITDPPITGCNECGAEGSLEKLMSLGSFHLKGSGWYLTDYARKNTQNTTDSEVSKENNKSEKSKDTT
ncbi:MAG: zinc ribbon domain-containing protein [Pseudomonadota bacterium]